jgi:hypothetical protein
MFVTANLYKSPRRHNSARGDVVGDPCTRPTFTIPTSSIMLSTRVIMLLIISVSAFPPARQKKGFINYVQSRANCYVARNRTSNFTILFVNQIHAQALYYR